MEFNYLGLKRKLYLNGLLRGIFFVWSIIKTLKFGCIFDNFAACCLASLSVFGILNNYYLTTINNLLNLEE